MKKKAFGFGSLVVSCLLLVVCCLLLVVSQYGCGQTQPATTTTTVATTTTTMGPSVTVKGSSSTTGISSLHALAALTSATVTISKPASGSYDVTTVGTGVTDADGNYSIDVPVADIETLADENGKVNNLIIAIEKDGTTVGCVLTTIGTGTGDVGYPPTADGNRYKKSLMTRKSFAGGMDPKKFDYESKIERKFEDMSTYGTDAAGLDKLGKMATAIKDAEAARDDIGLALGISAANLLLLDAKGKELNDTWIKPIFKSAFDNKTGPPNRATLDEASANMEKAMKDYAISLGLTEQQYLDLKSMFDKGMQKEMKEEGLGNEPAYKEMERRDMANKIIDLFNAQYDAAYVLANATPSSGGTSFKDANAAGYAAFTGAASTILATLKTKMGDTTITDPGTIGAYLGTNFFDLYIFPPATAMPSKEGESFGEGGKGSMEDIMVGYASTRIMVYFMQFLPPEQRGALFQALGTSIQPIFYNRFGNPLSDYYMGPDFWSTNPTPDTIKAKLTAFQTALDAATENAIGTKFSIFGANETYYKNAFKILNAPPTMM